MSSHTGNQDLVDHSIPQTLYWTSLALPSPIIAS